MSDSRGNDRGHPLDELGAGSSAPSRRQTPGEQHAPDEPQPYRDPYAALGLLRDATLEAIKDAYFKLVREHPPERDPDAFKAIRAAYDRVRTAERRLETDLLLLQPELPLPAEEDAAEFDLSVHQEDLLAAARALSDLERTDFRQDFREVKAQK